jgi:hypothetical protein
MELKLEVREQENKTVMLGTAGMFTPPVTLTMPADYWKYRVMLSRRQAIVGFPKFGTIGIGFAEEDDWNTNLPYTSSTEQIFNHIKHNKGDDAISDDDCRAAIQMIQYRAASDALDRTQ